jgi:hypothetical protein
MRAMPRRNKQIEQDIKDAMLRAPAATTDMPPTGGATLDVDGSKFSISPASIRTTRDIYERQLARVAKRTQDDAWLVISPRGDVLALMVWLGRHWSIYRRSGGMPWRKDQEAEVTHRKDVEDDWKTVARGIVKLTI